jgi:hypothetical protein
MSDTLYSDLTPRVFASRGEAEKFFDHRHIEWHFDPPKIKFPAHKGRWLGFCGPTEACLAHVYVDEYESAIEIARDRKWRTSE